jgi:hypothetical protein
MMLRIVQLTTMLGLYALARYYEVYFGLKYAAAMTALWFMIEIAARMNPGSFNNPMMDSGDATGIAKSSRRASEKSGVRSAPRPVWRSHCSVSR